MIVRRRKIVSQGWTIHSGTAQICRLGRTNPRMAEICRGCAQKRTVEKRSLYAERLGSQFFLRRAHGAQNITITGAPA